MKRFIIVVLLLFLSIFEINTYAKYYSEDKIECYTEVAKPVLNIEKAESINNENEYFFKITNFNNDIQNEIIMEFYLEIYNDDKNKLYDGIELFCNDEKIKIEDGKTEQFELPIDNKIQYEFKIRVKENKIVDKGIKIDVHCVQV